MLVSFANREPSAQELGAEADDADNASSYRSQQQNNLAFGDEPPPPTSNNVGFAPVTVSAPVAPANVATVPDTSSDPPTPPSTTAPALASPPTPHALDIANTVLPAMQDQLVNSWAAGQQRAGGKVLIAVADQTGSAASGDADARTVDAISAPTEEAARNLFGPVAWLANTNAAMEQAPQHVREWFDGRVQALKDSGTRVYMQVLRAFSSSAPAPTDDNDDCGAPGGSCRR